MRVVDFLNHGPDETCEVRQVALQNCFAEVHIRKQPLERIGQLAVGRGGEEGAGHVSPIRSRRESQVLLAFEVMEEAALGQPRRFANILNACGCIALGADDVQGRVE